MSSGSDLSAEKVVELTKKAMERGEIPAKLIAVHVGVTQAAVSRWLSGAGRPKGKNLEKLVELLRIVAGLLKEGKLPLDPPARTRKERMERIDDLLQSKKEEASEA